MLYSVGRCCRVRSDVGTWLSPDPCGGAAECSRADDEADTARVAFIPSRSSLELLDQDYALRLRRGGQLGQGSEVVWSVAYKYISLSLHITY
jgi:hypothetical protein